MPKTVISGRIGDRVASGKPSSNIPLDKTLDKLPPGYWENPQIVAGHYEAILQAPTFDWESRGINPGMVESNYRYFQNANDNRPSSEWKPLDEGDPYLNILRTIPEPLKGEEFPGFTAKLPAAARMINAVTGYDQITKSQFHQTPKKVSPSEAVIMDDAPTDWDALPSWQKTVSGIMASPMLQGAATMLPFSVYSLAGAAAGFTVGNVPGALVGAAAPMILGAGLGLMADPESTAKMEQIGMSKSTAEQVQKVAMSGMYYLNLGAEHTEKAIGTAIQLEAAEDKGKLDQALNSIHDVYAASAGTYESFSTQLPIHNIPAGIEWVVDMVKYGETDVKFAKQGEAWHLGKVDPVPIDKYGVARLEMLTQAIKKGQAPAEALAGVQEVFGFSGLYTDLNAQIVLDPLNIVPFVSKSPIKAWAHLTDNKIMLNALDMSKRKGAVETMRIFGNLSQTANVDDIGKMGRLFGKITKDNKLQQLEKLPDQRNLKEYLNGLTPASQAELGGRIARDYIGAGVANANDLTQIQKIVDSLAAGTPGVAAEIDKIINTPMGRTMQTTLKDFMATEGKTLFAKLEVGAPSRQLLYAMADMVGEKNPSKLVKKILGMDGADAVYKQMSEAAKKTGNEALLQNPKFTPEGVKAAVKYFESGMPHNLDGMKAMVLNSVNEYAVKWGVDYYKVAPPVWPVRFFGGAMKSAQSILLLGLNPMYLVNNVVNNAVTAFAEGVFGVVRPSTTKKYFMDVMGWEAARYDDAVGPADLGNRQTSAVQNAMKGKDTTQLITDLFRGAAEKSWIAPFLKPAWEAERLGGNTALYKGTKRYMDTAYHSNLVEMPPELIKAAEAKFGKATVRRARNMMREAKTPKDFQALRGGKIKQGTNATDFIDATATTLGKSSQEVRTILADTEVLDMINSQMAKGASLGDATTVVADHMQAQIHNMRINDLPVRAQEIANRITEHGFVGAVEWFAEMSLGRGEMHLISDYNIQSRFERINNSNFDQDTVSLIHDAGAKFDDAFWKNQDEFEVAEWNAVLGALGFADIKHIESLPKGQRGLFKAVDNYYSLNRKFFQDKRVRMKQYFDTVKERSPVENAAEWKRVQAENKKGYKALASAENEAQLHLHRQYYASHVAKYGKNKSVGAAEYVKAMQEATFKRQKMVMDFHDFLDGNKAKTDEIKAITEGFTPKDAPVLWPKFKEIYHKHNFDSQQAAADATYKAMEEANGRYKATPEEVETAQAEIAKLEEQISILDDFQQGDLLEVFSNIRRVAGDTFGISSWKNGRGLDQTIASTIHRFGQPGVINDAVKKAFDKEVYIRLEDVYKDPIQAGKEAEIAFDALANSKLNDIAKSGKVSSPSTAPKGWKLHLTTKNKVSISKYLKDKGYVHKIGKNAGQAGKDITIYVGKKDDAIRIAKEINKDIGNLLDNPTGDVLLTDVIVDGKVMGRFDPRDNKFHQYGGRGFPYLKADQMQLLYGNMTKAEAAKRALIELKNTYGAEIDLIDQSKKAQGYGIIPDEPIVTTPEGMGYLRKHGYGPRIEDDAYQFIPRNYEDVIQQIKRQIRSELTPEQRATELSPIELEANTNMILASLSYGDNKPLTPDTFPEYQAYLINRYVEGPLQGQVKSMLDEGKNTISSNYYGPGKKGVWWLPEGKADEAYGAQFEPHVEPQQLFLPEPVKIDPDGTSALGTIDATVGKPFIKSKIWSEGTGWYVQPILEELMMQGYTPGQTKVGGDIGTLDPEFQAMWGSWIDENMSEKARSKLAAVNVGGHLRDMAMLDYGKRTGLNTMLDMSVPYHFWFLNSSINWSIRALDRPAFLAHLGKLAEFGDKAHDEKSNLPSRLKGKHGFPMPYLPDWAGNSVWVDEMGKFFPVLEFMRPIDRVFQANNRLNRKAEYEITNLVYNGQLSDADGKQAIETKEGTIWDEAYAKAQEDERHDPFDYMSMFVGLPLWLTIPKAFAQGREDELSPLPPSRFFQTLATATGIEPIRLLDVEDHIRKSLSLSTYGEWETYYVDRQLANMAVENPAQADAIELAMVERSGDLYEKAMQRVEIEMMLRSPGMSTVYTAKQGGGIGEVAQSMLFGWLPQHILPESELVRRGLKDEYRAAWTEFNNGNPEAMDQFYADHPEQRSSVALFEEPEVRMKKYVINEIWERWNNLPDLHQTEVKQHLGKTFTDHFLYEETRDYDSLDIETLSTWGNMMGAFLPNTIDTAEGIKLELSDPTIATKYQQYMTEQDKKFPNIMSILGAYGQAPPAQKQIMRDSVPMISEFWAWQDEKLANNPDLIPHLVSEGNKMYGADPVTQALYYDYKATRHTLFPDYYDLPDIAYNFDEDEVSPTVRQAAYDRLQQAYKWENAQLAMKPQLIPFAKSEQAMAKAVLGKDYKEEYGIEQDINLYDLDKDLVRQLTRYHMTDGQGLTKGARLELRRQWEDVGEPYDDFETWLENSRHLFL
jgi:hypothetical protein